MNEIEDFVADETQEMSPYSEALDFIVVNRGASSSIGMAKLILSLYNPIHSFGVAECAWNLDIERCALASRVIAHYLENGENDELRFVGREVYKGFPDLIELSNAADNAKNAVRARWRTGSRGSSCDE